MATRGRKKKLETLLRHEKYYSLRQGLEETQRQLEQMGIRFAKTPLPSIPKRITEASLRKLENVSRETIAKRGFFLNEETGKESKVTSKAFEKIEEEYYSNNLMDEVDLFHQGIYSTIYDTSITNPDIANYVQGLYEMSMSQFGGEAEFYKYLIATGQREDFITALNGTLKYKEGTKQKETAMQKFQEILTKRPITLEDSSKINDIMDTDYSI